MRTKIDWQKQSSQAHAPSNLASLALERIKGLHLQNHLLLLAMMELVRQSKGQDEMFNALCAVANGMAELDVAFNRAERDMLNMMPRESGPLH